MSPLKLLPEIIESHFEEWEFGTTYDGGLWRVYTAQNKKLGCRIVFGFLCCRVTHPFQHRFSLWTGFRICRTLRRLKAEKTFDMILGTEETP